MGNRTYRRWAKHPKQSLLGFVQGQELAAAELEAQRLTRERLWQEQQAQAGTAGVRVGQYLRHHDGEIWKVEAVELSETAPWHWILQLKCAGAVFAPELPWGVGEVTVESEELCGEAQYAFQGKRLHGPASKPLRKDVAKWYLDQKGIVLPPRAAPKAKKPKAAKAAVPVWDFVTTFPPLVPGAEGDRLGLHTRLGGIVVALGRQIAAMQQQQGWKTNPELLLLRNALASEARDVLAEYQAYFGEEAAVAFRKYLESQARST